MATSQDVIEQHADDPVTKAVVDNIMGNLPTKKPLVRCDDCELSFTSQIVLDAHLQGARHAKQMKSKSIMANLKDTEVSITKDQESNGLKCNVCNVCLNSIQQLQTHLNGNRHKKKMLKGDWTSPLESDDAPSASTIVTASPSPTNPMKSVSLSCETCNKFFNSQAQYNVHLTSQKHADKVDKKSIKNKRVFPYWKKNKQNGCPKLLKSLPKLNANFVSGGYTKFE